MKALALLLVLVTPSAWALPLVADLDFRPQGYGTVYGEIHVRYDPPYVVCGGCLYFTEVYGAPSSTDGEMHAVSTWNQPGAQGTISMLRDNEMFNGDGVFNFTMETTLAVSISVESGAPANARAGGFVNFFAGEDSRDFAFTLLERAVYEGDFAIWQNGAQVFGTLEAGRYTASGGIPMTSGGIPRRVSIGTSGSGSFGYLNDDALQAGESASASITRARSLRLVAVPEPATMLLFGAGLFGIGVMRRRRVNA